MQDQTGQRIAILATHALEYSGLTVPQRALAEAGAKVIGISPESGEIRGWDKDDWSESIPVDVSLESASAGRCDALPLPDRQINPDLLRGQPQAVARARAFHHAKKTIPAICHAPRLLSGADLLRGRRATSYKSVRSDVENSRAIWVDAAVGCEEGTVASRKAGNLDAFCNEISEEICERIHRGRAVA